MNTIVRSVWTPTIKSINVLDRTIRFKGTEETEDRTGDVIEVDGWMLDNFVKNPVFLWDHDPSLGPIGRVKQIIREGKALLFDVEFAPKEVSEFADRMFKLFEAGFLKAVSVGFLPKEFEPILTEDGNLSGLRFTKQELLELSAVSIPAHQDALAASAYSKALEESHAIRQKVHGKEKSKVVTLEQFTKTALAELKSEAKNNEEDDEVMKEQLEKLQKEVEDMKKQIEGLTTLQETVELSKSAMTTLNSLLGEKLGKSAPGLETPTVTSDEGQKPTQADVNEGVSKALASLLDRVQKGTANFKTQGDK